MCKVVVFGHTGNCLGSHVAQSVNEAMLWADAHCHTGEATVRLATTSDGTHWPDYGGRVVAVRYREWHRWD
jgi:hypothetical protein